MLCTHAKQNPDLRLSIFTWILLSTYFVLLAICIATFLKDGDAITNLGMAILMPLSTLLAISQYRSTYFAHRKSTQTSITLLSLVGGLFLIALITASYERISLGLPVPWMSLILPMLSVAIVAFSVVWIQSERVDNLDNQTPATFTSREIIVCLAGLMILALAIPYFLNSTPMNFGENVSINQAPSIFPAQAEDISYCRNHGTLAGEFTINESGFREWVNSGIGSLASQAANIPIESITKPVTITRYPSLSEKLYGEDQITVSAGLKYQWRFQDESVHAIFDRANTRAYYYGNRF